MDLSELAAYAEEKFNIREQFKWADFPGFSVLAAPYSGKWAALLMRQKDPATGKDIQRCDIKCGIGQSEEYGAPYLTQPFRMKGVKWLGVIFDERTEPEVVFRLFDKAVYAGEESGYTLILEDPKLNDTASYGEIALPQQSPSRFAREPEIPERIHDMMRMYRYGDGTFSQKCRNFYRQGKFMEDYEDDAPWSGEFRQYFPTYHDLNTEQLRGYFTWRSRVRKGNWGRVSASMAYIYIYELLNGIGAASPQESVQKLEEFETGYLDSGIGDPSIRENLHRWLMEFSIVNSLPLETALKYADPEMIRKDEALLTLRFPKDHSDEAVFSALCTFAGEKLKLSPVITKSGAKGMHLFTEIWRYGSQFFSYRGDDLFTACFGKQSSYHWYPLANAVYYWKKPAEEHTEYELNAFRKYVCHYGVWMERKFENLYFEKKRFLALMHEADRLLRSYLKTGHALKEKPEEAWAAPYILPVIEMDRKAEEQAAKPQITIDLSGLERIRQDALKTRDSLLTEEEMAEEPAVPEIVPARAEPEKIPAPDIPDQAPFPEEILETPELPLDALQIRILQKLLRGEAAEPLIRENHLIPSVVTDAINEALYDEIGDSVLECDDSIISIVDDYREDIIEMLGGTNV